MYHISDCFLPINETLRDHWTLNEAADLAAPPPTLIHRHCQTYVTLLNAICLYSGILAGFGVTELSNDIKGIILKPSDGQTVLKSGPLTQRASIWWLLSSALCRDWRERATRHHRHVLQWVVCVKETQSQTERWQSPGECEQASTALHTWPVFQNIIWQRVHMSYAFFCRRKPNRLKEACCSQTSLPGSDPSAHWHQREVEIYLATKHSCSTKHSPHWSRTGQSRWCYDVTTGSTHPNLIGCSKDRC